MSRRDDLDPLDATAQAALVRAGEATPLELCEAAIRRIERRNPAINAVIHERFERAREEARGELPDGPFRGVPFLLKDLDVFQAGEPFHGGMRFLRDAGFVPTHSSVLVERYRRAGFVILGKTNTPELGLTVTTEPQAHGPSRNPWSLEHSTGGSSGGSAAAVAACLVPAAHASDGGGSIRIPASECGLVGLKPSRGRISMAPDHGEYWSGFVNDHVVTRSVRDSAAILDATAGPEPGDPYFAPPPARAWAAEAGADPGRLRVGVLARAPGAAAPVHPACAEAARETGRRLAALGHAVEEAHPAALDEATLGECFLPVIAAWTAMGLRHFGERVGRPVKDGDLEPATAWLAEQGRAIAAQDFLAALDRLHGWARRVAQWWSEPGFDLLVTPTIAVPPPRLGELAPGADLEASIEKILALIPFTPPFNATGQPAISLPLATSEQGLPIGVQLVAAYPREDLLIRVSAQLEAAHPWDGRMPELAALEAAA